MDSLLIIPLILGIFCMTFFPVYLWAYGVSVLQQVEFNRFRFMLGGVIGIISVLLIYFLTEIRKELSLNILYSSLIFLVILYGIIYGATRIGSGFIRVFLRKVALYHSVLIFLLLTGAFILSQIFHGQVIFVMGFNILFAALIEESSKHLLSVGTTGIQLRFTARDMILLNFFCVLGFVFAENLLYLIHDYWKYDHFSFFQWGFRSFFTLIAHIFSASICAYYWWKALSFPFLSRNYIFYFCCGFVLATGAHTIYNLLAQENSFFGIIIFALIGYTGFTYVLNRQYIP